MTTDYQPDIGHGQELMAMKTAHIMFTQVIWADGLCTRGKRRLGKSWKRGVCVGQAPGYAIVLKNGRFMWGTSLRNEEDGRKALDIAGWLAHPETKI